MTPSAPRAARSLSLLLALALAGCLSAPDREAVRVLEDIAAGPAASALKQMTPTPERSTVTFLVEGRQTVADLYRPAAPIGAPLVLVPGLSPDGKDDARLVALAESLARARFLVLVPDLEAARKLQISLEDARQIGDAAIHLAKMTAPDGFSGVGIAAVSYAVGPAVIAALEPEVEPHVSFLVGLGGYYDTAEMLTYLTTGGYRAPGSRSWRRHRVDPGGVWVFVLSNLDRIENAADRRRLQEMAERRLHDPNAPIGDLTARLGPEGGAIYALLANREPDRVPSLIAALPAAIRADLDALSLRGRDLTPLAGRVILIHGQEDSVIPYTESEELARAIGRVELFLVPGFSHVDSRPVGPEGQRALIAAMRALLDRRRAE
jgi:pimeloyl-ACP methyl ester carboxylesterase